MTIKDLVIKNRSCRRFDHSSTLTIEILRELVDIGRLTPSASNLQPLKYHLSVEPEVNEKIFDCLAWAGYLEDWDGPAPDERPSGYITILLDQKIKSEIDCDHGIAAQTILLAAAERGIAGCIIASVNREELHRQLNLPDHLKILLVIALGKAKEIIQLEEVKKDGDIKYWRDEEQVHHVPKRKLEDIIIG
ncbi:MAG: nitroreductase family protein [Calditrichaceae bacterium]|nr:nitroreductase family protein [Calditrichaceae bacterium]MBN2707882.1 nitroreductase family protein [Calditrichaceae bacterium]RQV97830.1 MAG: nitroreductase family protein [Calditrichota bacterium]